jgi:hypothetical protein
MRLVEVKEMREEIRQRLYRLDDVIVRSSGVYGGEYYRNEYKLTDMQIFHEFEAPDLTDATDTFRMEKPTIILYVTEDTTEAGTVDKSAYMVEFQLVVNFEPATATEKAGFVALMGYLELLRVIVNPREKGTWLGIGLAPRKRHIGPILNGGEIKSNLRDRLLVQSLVGYFTYVGAE